MNRYKITAENAVQHEHIIEANSEKEPLSIARFTCCTKLNEVCSSEGWSVLWAEEIG